MRYKFLDLGEVNAPYAEEISRAVERVVRSGRYIGGEENDMFESRLSRLAGTRYAVGVSNGLDALRLILRAYIEEGFMQHGDEVIVPSNTYIATILAVVDNGLRPVFAEPRLDTMNICGADLEGLVTPRTRVILTVHLYGRVAYDAEMQAVADRHGLRIVEDNAQAIGAKASNGHSTGSLGHAAAFSFYPTKNIGAMGDAGAVTTDDEATASRIRALANYGSIQRYHNVYQGFNCRLDPIQAAVLNVKLPYLTEENGHRRKIAEIYNSAIDNRQIINPLWGDDEMVWHQYVVRSTHRKAFREQLAACGVETDIHYPTPPHRQPALAEYNSLSLPVAERLADEVVSLPISSCTSEEDAREIARIINGISI